MIERERGRIVHIASDAGRVGSSGEVVYSATKGGIIAFGKALAREVARHGITVNSVCPGPTDTALLGQVAEYSQADVRGDGAGDPLRRVAQPDGHRRRGRLSGLRRRRLHDRADDLGQRRPDDALKGLPVAELLNVDVADRVAVLTLNRPDRLNAIGTATADR